MRLPCAANFAAKVMLFSFVQLSESMSFLRGIVGWLESMLSESVPKKVHSFITKNVFLRFISINT
jgi:hypothetical protein